MEVLRKAAGIGQLIMGVVFLVAGGAKVWEPMLSFWDAVPHAALLGLGAQARWVAQAALLMGPIEWGLGLALLFNWRPRLILPLATVLMVFFVTLTGLAFYQGSEANCGCFGALVERTPGEALVEDILMLGLLILAWRLRPLLPVWAAGRWAVLGGTLLAVGVGGARLLPEVDRMQNSDLRAGVRLTGLSLKGVDIELMQGAYLIELFSPKCSHCMKEVPKLNEWSRTEGVPPIVGLNIFEQDSQELREFKERLQPLYPIATISTTDFLRFTAGHGYPRLALVRDGVVQVVWERYQTPSVEELRRLGGS